MANHANSITKLHILLSLKKYVVLRKLIGPIDIIRPGM